MNKKELVLHYREQVKKYEEEHRLLKDKVGLFTSELRQALKNLLHMSGELRKAEKDLLEEALK
jgi:hypothetical protein